MQLSDHLHWIHKNEYLQLMRNFVEFHINGEEFSDKFCEMIMGIEKEYKILEKNFE